MEGAIILWDVVEEHLDEVEFFWAAWERGLASPRDTLGEVAEREERRLLANVDGLIEGGAEVAARLLVPALESDDAGRRTGAALALLMSGERRAIDAVLEGLREGGAGVRSAAERALGLGGAPWIDEVLAGVLASGAPEAAAAALSALSFRRWEPARELAARAIHAGDPGIREQALKSALALGLPEASAACRERVRRRDASAFGEGEPVAPLFAAVSGDPADLDDLLGALDVPSLRRAAVWALGYSGRLAAAEACLPLLDDPGAGRLAGEAFAAITGLPLETHALPEDADGEALPALADDLALDLIPRAEDALPRLDRRSVEAWWSNQRARFDPRRRYLLGAPFGPESLLSALSRGPMRRRHALALELSIRTRGRLAVETRAFSSRQRSELAAARSVRAIELDALIE